MDQHPRIALGEGDTVVFSSRVIPGNERAIGTVQDNLVRRGVRLITDRDHLTHVSGHPARDELKRLYALVRPKYSVPVHGEFRHLSAHAELARELQIKPILLEDGDVLSLFPGVPEVVDSAPVGKLVLDGSRLVPLQGGVMAARRRLLFNGVAVASVAVDQSGRLIGQPRVSAPGLYEVDDPEMTRIHREFATALDDMANTLRRDDELFTEAAKTALRRVLGKRLAKRPMVDVHLLRV
jgi:ribonuclease J